MSMAKEVTADDDRCGLAARLTSGPDLGGQGLRDRYLELGKPPISSA